LHRARVMGTTDGGAGKRMATFALVTLLVSLFACEAPTGSASSCSLHAQEFDQSCRADSDCIAVVEVYGCGSCACQTGAINVSDQTKYQAALSGSQSSTAGSCYCPCEGAPRCCGGVCTNACSGCPADGGQD